MEQRPRKPENLERSVDHELAEILGSAELAGFGANAFVFRVPGEKIPGRIAEDLKKLGEDVEIPDNVAMKMLKVYEAGTAAREVSMHQKAWNALRGEEKNPDYASIPRVYFSHTAHFDEEELEHLAELGFKVGSSADVILMDFIQGRDLKEILAEQVMQRSEGADPHQIQRTADSDSDYRYEYLKKRGFTVHPQIAERLERTTTLLQKNGVFHNDLHEANVIIDGDPTSPDARVFLIDFGRADTVPLREYGEKPVDDLMVVRRIRAHQPEQAGQPGEDETDWLADLERFRELALAHQLYEQFRKAFMENHEKAIAGLRAGDERTLSQTTIRILGALEDKLFSRVDAKEVIVRLKNECRVIPIKRKLDWLLRYLSQPEER